MDENTKLILEGIKEINQRLDKMESRMDKLEGRMENLEHLENVTDKNIRIIAENHVELIKKLIQRNLIMK